jgi:hypothetical protein
MAQIPDQFAIQPSPVQIPQPRNMSYLVQRAFSEPAQAAEKLAGDVSQVGGQIAAQANDQILKNDEYQSNLALANHAYDTQKMYFDAKSSMPPGGVYADGSTFADRIRNNYEDMSKETLGQVPATQQQSAKLALLKDQKNFELKALGDQYQEGYRYQTQNLDQTLERAKEEIAANPTPENLDLHRALVAKLVADSHLTAQDQDRYLKGAPGNFLNGTPGKAAGARGYRGAREG